MATIIPAATPTTSPHNIVISWEGLADSGDVGVSVGYQNYPDRSVQVVGAMPGGARMVIEGSNDGGTTWFTLTAPDGGDIEFTSAGGFAIVENTQRIRPRVTAGSGLSLSVYLQVRGKA